MSTHSITCRSTSIRKYTVDLPAAHSVDLPAAYSVDLPAIYQHHTVYIDLPAAHSVDLPRAFKVDLYQRHNVDPLKVYRVDQSNSPPPASTTTRGGRGGGRGSEGGAGVCGCVAGRGDGGWEGVKQ